MIWIPLDPHVTRILKAKFLKLRERKSKVKPKSQSIYFITTTDGKSKEAYQFINQPWLLQIHGNDSSQHEDKYDRKSIVRYIFMFCETPVSWGSKKEPVVTLSLCEVEYIFASLCTC